MSHVIPRRLARIAIRLAMATLIASFIGANADSARAEPGIIIDRAELEAFVDGFVEGRREAFDVVGVTVSVVHAGRTIFAKGYGHDDLAAGRGVDANRSLFRPGSISKTLTWTAVMQLHEEGKLDLEEDIQRYLPDVPIPETFDQPITMLDLMAQAPGFEDSAMGHLFVEAPEDVLPLGEYLRTHRPARVRPPGMSPAYSNYGTALAGKIVANLTGMPFEDAIDDRILGPLGMERTTFREPWGEHRPGAMAEELHVNVSKGYVKKNGGFVSSDFVYIGQIGPAGALSTTATDMARWMLAHLGDGALGASRILRAETARRMHSQHFTLDPELNGMAHGFIESRIGGYRAYGHGGGTIHFLSDWQVVPALDFGVFISANTTGGGGKLIRGFAAALVERFFPPGPEFEAVPPPPADFSGRAGRFEGTYLATRRAYTTVEALLNPSAARVTSTPDGFLLVTSALGENRLVEVAPLTFRDTKTGALLKFKEDGSGEISQLQLPVPVFVVEKVGAFEDPQRRLIFLGLAVLVFLCSLIGAWLRRAKRPIQSSGERAAARVTLLTSVLYVLGLGMVGLGLVPIAEDFRAVFFGFPPPLFVAGLTVLILAALGTVIACLLLVPVWTGSGWGAGRRLRHTFVVLIAAALLMVLWDGNAIGYHYF